MPFKTVFLAALVFLIVSCGTSEGDKTYKLEVPAANNVSVAGLMNTFTEAWNRKDSATLIGLMADDVVIMAGKDRISGKNEAADVWLRGTLPMTGNLKVTGVQSNAGAVLAYSAGTWTMNVTAPGQALSTSAGNHTFVWKKAADNTWKLTLVHIENYAP